MIEFVETTRQAQVDAGRWGELLRSGSPGPDLASGGASKAGGPGAQQGQPLGLTVGTAPTVEDPRDSENGPRPPTPISSERSRPGRPKWSVCCHRRTRAHETPDRHEPEFSNRLTAEARDPWIDRH